MFTESSRDNAAGQGVLEPRAGRRDVAHVPVVADDGLGAARGLMVGAPIAAAAYGALALVVRFLLF
jgi:hypothetical protein